MLETSEFNIPRSSTVGLGDANREWASAVADVLGGEMAIPCGVRARAGSCCPVWLG